MLEATRRHRVRLPETRVEIALIEWDGTGPLALLHHANGFCAALWDEVAQQLRRDYRVFAIDARGHGDSSAPHGDDAYAWPTLVSDLGAVAEQILAETGAGHFALGLGHSFGGALTLAAGSRRPGLFERIVMVDPVAFPPATDPLAALRTPDTSLAERARRRRHVWPSRAAARSHCEGKELFASWRPEALDLYIEHGLRELPDGRVELKCPPRVEAAIFSGGATLDLFERARGVTDPVQILRAKEGNFPIEIYRELAAEIPADVQLEEVAAGHLVPMERPDLVVEAVSRFAGLAG